MGKLIIKNTNTTRAYECKTTHTGNAYLQINKNSYLDLTTKTASGFHLRVKYCSNAANQTNTTIKTRTSQDRYSITTGYAGYSDVTETAKTTTAYSGITQVSASSKYSEYIHRQHDQTLSFSWNTYSSTTTVSLHYSSTTSTSSTYYASAHKYILASETIKTIQSHSYSNIQPYYSVKLATGTGYYYLDSTSSNTYLGKTETCHKRTTTTFNSYPGRDSIDLFI